MIRRTPAFAIWFSYDAISGQRRVERHALVVGVDHRADMARIARDPVTREWPRRSGKADYEVELVTEADWTHWTVEQLDAVTGPVLGCFGPGRNMFGSDWPVCLLAASYQEVVATVQKLVTALDESEQHAVWGGTAHDWYRVGAG